MAGWLPVVLNDVIGSEGGDGGPGDSVTAELTRGEEEKEKEG